MQNDECRMKNEEMSNRQNRSPRPFWLEPIPIGIAAVVVLASLGVIFQDRILGQHQQPNPADKSALPAGSGGGGFCDIPAPVKSTAFNPSSRKSE
jgi:hypothetical protein